MTVLQEPEVHRHLSPTSLLRVLGTWRTTAPAYAALADAIRGAVLAGTVPLGTRLPSERDLARTLGVSRTTTAAAYDVLRERGYAVGRTGVGTITVLPRGESAPVGRTRLPRLTGGDAPSPDERRGPGADTIDMSQAAPAAPPQLHAAYSRALEALPAYLPGLGYEPLGLQALREAVARRYTERGVPTGPEQILVTTGAQHAIATLLSTLVGRGDRVLVQSPTYAHALHATRAVGARLVGLPVGVADAPAARTARDGTDHGAGFDVDLFESTVRQVSPRLVYLVPDHHNPTGYSLTAAERERVRDVARRHRVTVVGDETLTDIGYPEATRTASAGSHPAPGPAGDDGRLAPELPPFVGDGADHGRVLAVGSASKTFWGGLRVGWVRAHPDLVARLARARGASDIATPVLEQLTVVELLAQRAAVLAERIPLLRRQRDVLVDGLRAVDPGWDVPRPPGGLSVWVGLGAPLAHALAAAAADRGVLLNPGPSLTPDGTAAGLVRLTFAPSEATLERALPRVAAAWDRVAADRDAR